MLWAFTTDFFEEREAELREIEEYMGANPMPAEGRTWPQLRRSRRTTPAVAWAR